MATKKKQPSTAAAHVAEVRTTPPPAEARDPLAELLAEEENNLQQFDQARHAAGLNRRAARHEDEDEDEDEEEDEGAAAPTPTIVTPPSPLPTLPTPVAAAPAPSPPAAATVAAAVEEEPNTFATGANREKLLKLRRLFM